MPDTAAIASANRSLRCGKCGFNLFGISEDGRCPECGMAAVESIVPDILTLPRMRHVRWLKRAIILDIASRIGFLLIHILRTLNALHFDEWIAEGHEIAARFVVDMLRFFEIAWYGVALASAISFSIAFFQRLPRWRPILVIVMLGADVIRILVDLIFWMPTNWPPNFQNMNVVMILSLAISALRVAGVISFWVLLAATLDRMSSKRIRILVCAVFIAIAVHAVAYFPEIYQQEFFILSDWNLCWQFSELFPTWWTEALRDYSEMAGNVGAALVLVCFAVYWRTVDRALARRRMKLGLR